MSYTDEVTSLLVTASETEPDFSGWLARVLVDVKNARGGWVQTEQRQGSWEAALVAQLIQGADIESW